MEDSGTPKLLSAKGAAYGWLSLLYAMSGLMALGLSWPMRQAMLVSLAVSQSALWWAEGLTLVAVALGCAAGGWSQDRWGGGRAWTLGAGSCAALAYLLLGFVALSPGMGGYVALRLLAGLCLGLTLPNTLFRWVDACASGERLTRYSWHLLLGLLGMGCGVALGNLGSWGYSWRIPFLLTGLIQGLVLLAFGLGSREPPLGIGEADLQMLFTEGNGYHPPRASLRALSPTAWLLILALFLITLPIGVIPWHFVDSYLVLYGFRESVAATLVLMCVLGVGTAFLWGGYGMEEIYRSSPRRLLLGGAGQLIAALPLWLWLFWYAPSGSTGWEAILWPAVVTFLATVLTVMPLPGSFAVAMNVTLPELRRTLHGFLIAAMLLGLVLGLGLGRLFVPLLGYGVTLRLNLLWWLFAAGVLFAVSLSCRRDLARQRDHLRQHVQERMDLPMWE